ncbi:MAG: hypothetical protein EOM25_14640, partial [Deltaproteobacteria bacterium]|nr:hypothetical protein [Deltaproteobacteria bacterium]
MIPCDFCKFYWDGEGECRLNPPTHEGFPLTPKLGGCGKGYPADLDKFDCGDCRWFRDKYCHKHDIAMDARSG